MCTVHIRFFTFICIVHLGRAPGLIGGGFWGNAAAYTYGICISAGIIDKSLKAFGVIYCVSMATIVLAIVVINVSGTKKKKD